MRPRFKAILGCSGVEVLLTAYQAPNMNAYAERFVRSIRMECLDQMISVRNTAAPAHRCTGASLYLMSHALGAADVRSPNVALFELGDWEARVPPV